MKKTLLGILIVVGLLVSTHGVLAKTTLSENKINAIVQVLRAFEVDESKITDIEKILRKDNPKTLQLKSNIINCIKSCPRSA